MLPKCAQERSSTNSITAPKQIRKSRKDLVDANIRTLALAVPLNINAIASTNKLTSQLMTSWAWESETHMRESINPSSTSRFSSLHTTNILISQISIWPSGGRVISGLEGGINIKRLCPSWWRWVAVKAVVEIEDERAGTAGCGGGDVEGEEGCDVWVGLGADSFVDLAGGETVGDGACVDVVC
jgi:hypothetical protein